MARASFFPGRSAHLNADVYRDDISFLGTAFERGARQFPDESFNKCIQEELSPVGVLVVARYWSGEQLAVLTPLSSMARASDFTLLVLTFIALTACGEPSLADHAVKSDVYVVKPYIVTTGRPQKERALMLRLKKPSASSPVPNDRIDAVEWLDSLLQGVYHPLDDKGQVLEDVPETRLGFQADPERRPGSGKKRLNLKKPSELDRQFVYQPLNMGTLRLERPVRLERPLPLPAAFRHRDSFPSGRRPPRLRSQVQQNFNEDYNAPLNQRPNLNQQSNNYNNNQQQNYDNQQRPNYQNSNNQRPNYQQQSANNQQRPNYEVQIYTQENNNQQDEYQQQNNNQQDGYQEQENNSQESDYQQENYNQEQQDYQQPDVGNQYNAAPNDPYNSSQQEPYRPPSSNNENFNSNPSNYNQQNRPPGRQYVFNVDVYVNEQRRKRRNQHRPLRSPPQRYPFRHSFRPLKK